MVCAAISGSRPDIEIGAREDGGDPDGRCPTADHGWPHCHTVSIHRTGGGPSQPAPAAEDQPASSAASQGDRRRRSEIGITTRPVVPTFEPPSRENQPSGRFWPPSSESRANFTTSNQSNSSITTLV